MKPVEITLPSSEYHDVPSSKVNTDTLNTIRDRIRNRNKTYRIETGRDLIKAKALLPHGEFRPWLEANFKWSESTAQNYMNAARLADKNPEVAKLAPSAVIALAAPSVPETVKSEVVAEIAVGKVPTAKEIKVKVAEAKAAKPSGRKEAVGATVTTLPKNGASASTEATAVTDDLVRRLKAAGLDVSRAAFDAAFPGYLVIADDEFEAEIDKAKAA